ncbi:MAG: hypothetical protein LBJ00_02755 [Planctomycetaceae bacterium]|nr:hypothetical protein [Planctomycetaceae bacterium]
MFFVLFVPSCYTVAGKAIGFAFEQPLHVVTLTCPASGILKQLEYKKFLSVIPMPVWAVGFAHEQPLHVVALACSASGILKYTVAGKAIGFAPEQPLHVVALAYSASGILK